MLVSVIIPAYKQEKTIKADIERIAAVLASTRFKYEISHTTRRPPSSVMLQTSAFLSSFKSAAITGNEKIQIIAKLVTTLVIRKY
jgi:hypothetical protein